MTVKAVLFDVDGTLVDSNYAHVAAWSAALEKVGHPVDSWRIHRAIGMDSSLLLDELLGGSVGELGDAAKAEHAAAYLGAAGHLRAFEHARELVEEVGRRGQVAVLATSSSEEELAASRAVLLIDESIGAVTSSQDVEQAKPAPDIVEVALERSGTAAAEAVFVGDSTWDVRAAVKAGVPCIGLLSGGTGRLELLEAGALAVYDDAADLLAHYDEHLLD